VDGLSSLSAIYYKEPEAFVKILRESKNQKWEEREEEENDVADSTGGTMGTYQAQAQNNDYGSSGAQADVMGDNVPQGSPQQQGRPQVQGSNPFDAEDDLLGGKVSPTNSRPAFANIKIPMSTVRSVLPRFFLKLLLV
jgi:hypothetical protein